LAGQEIEMEFRDIKGGNLIKGEMKKKKAAKRVIIAELKKRT
jgi:hypothetical protein